MPWNKRGRNNNNKRRRNSNNNGNNYDGKNRSGTQAAKVNTKRLRWLHNQFQRLKVHSDVTKPSTNLETRIKAALKRVARGLITRCLIRENAKPFSVYTNPTTVPLIFKRIVLHFKCEFQAYPRIVVDTTPPSNHSHGRFTKLDTIVTGWSHALPQHIPLLKRMHWQVMVQTIRTIILTFCDRTFYERMDRVGPYIFGKCITELKASVESMDASVLWQAIMETFKTAAEENLDPDDPIDLLLASSRSHYLESPNIFTFDDVVTSVVQLLRQRLRDSSLITSLLTSDDNHQPFVEMCDMDPDVNLKTESQEQRENQKQIMERITRLRADTEAYEALRKAGFLPVNVISTLKTKEILKDSTYLTLRYKEFDLSKFILPLWTGDHRQGWLRSATASLKAKLNKTDTHQAKKAKTSQNNKSQRNSQNSNGHGSHAPSRLSSSSNSSSTTARTATAPMHAVTANVNTSPQCSKCLRTNHTTQNCRFKKPCNRCKGYHGPRGPCRCKLCNKYHHGYCKQNQ